jgi:hypothetical protein
MVLAIPSVLPWSLQYSHCSQAAYCKCSDGDCNKLSAPRVLHTLIAPTALILSDGDINNLSTPMVLSVYFQCSRCACSVLRVKD